MTGSVRDIQINAWHTFLSYFTGNRPPPDKHFWPQKIRRQTGQSQKVEFACDFTCRQKRTAHTVSSPRAHCLKPFPENLWGVDQIMRPAALGVTLPKTLPWDHCGVMSFELELPIRPLDTLLPSSHIRNQFPILSKQARETLAYLHPWLL